MVDATEGSYPGRADFDHDLDDFDELLKVQIQSCITPGSCHTDFNRNSSLAIDV